MKKSLIALAFGTLALGMAEFAMMGILPYVASDFGIHDGYIAVCGFRFWNKHIRGRSSYFCLCTWCVLRCTGIGSCTEEVTQAFAYGIGLAYNNRKSLCVVCT